MLSTDEAVNHIFQSVLLPLFERFCLVMLVTDWGEATTVVDGTDSSPLYVTYYPIPHHDISFTFSFLDNCLPPSFHFFFCVFIFLPLSLTTTPGWIPKTTQFSPTIRTFICLSFLILFHFIYLTKVLSREPHVHIPMHPITRRPHPTPRPSTASYTSSPYNKHIFSTTISVPQWDRVSTCLRTVSCDTEPIPVDTDRLHHVSMCLLCWLKCLNNWTSAIARSRTMLPPVPTVHYIWRRKLAMAWWSSGMSSVHVMNVLNSQRARHAQRVWIRILHVCRSDLRNLVNNTATFLAPTSDLSTNNGQRTNIIGDTTTSSDTATANLSSDLPKRPNIVESLPVTTPQHHQTHSTYSHSTKSDAASSIVFNDGDACSFGTSASSMLYDGYEAQFDSLVALVKI